jgi:hypothetical protein
MDTTTAAVTWTYSGRPDGLVGTGATTAERLIGYGTAALLTTAIVGADLARAEPVAPTGWQLALLAFFAYDIAGGAVANMLNSCKRLYHAPPQPGEGRWLRLLKDARIFTAIHIHPVLIALTLDESLWAAGTWYLLLQLAVWTVLAAPLYLRRGIATCLTMLAILGDQLLLPLGSGLEWVIPALFIKIVMGHAVREEPYAAPTQLPS